MPLAKDKKKKQGNIKKPVRRILICTSIALGLIAFDVFSVSVRQIHMRSGTDLSAYVNSSHVTVTTETALRGSIYDRNGVLIAQDNRTYDIICILSKTRVNGDKSPAYITDIEDAAEKIASVLNVDSNIILGYLQAAEEQGSYQTELGTYGRQLTQEQKEKIEAFELTGIEFEDSIQRIYPNGTFASNLIGYAQTNDEEITVGKMGLEQILDSYLSGTDGYSSSQVDKNGNILAGMQSEIVSAKNGDNVYLTIDADVQNSLEESMQMTASMFEDVTGIWGAAMEIKTGKVIAWGQYPSFDPNTLEITEYNNIGAELPYEPGSTLKTFIWAAAINEGKYDGDATTDGNQYCYTSDIYNNPVRTYSEDNYGCIYNAHETKYGSIDFDHGLIYSLNTVSAAIQNEVITPDIHLEYLKKFGFFSAVDTDGLQEQTGLLNFTYPGDKVSLSYGQGSTVTMLQLLQGYSAIFSDGTMVKPYFVESIKDSYDGSTVYQAETTVTGNPITAETAKEVQSILYHVVNDEDGTAVKFQIPECKLIGKTGTTEVATAEASYENSNITINSIMAALPADDPQILVYYAFQCKYDGTATYRTEPQINFLRKVAITYGLSDSAVVVDTDGNENTSATVTSSSMPSLLNHTLEYAESKLEGTGVNTILLGSGSTVVAQYPSAGTTVSTNDKIFLLTDKSSFVMPDMTGWTRSDVYALWNVTRYTFKVEGTGKVVSQSILPGTVVNKGTTIEVKFE